MLKFIFAFIWYWNHSGEYDVVIEGNRKAPTFKNVLRAMDDEYSVPIQEKLGSMTFVEYDAYTS